MKTGDREYLSAKLLIAEPEGLPAHMRPFVREVLRVRSEDKRKGHATSLMQIICQEADDNDMLLMLGVNPFADGMDETQLIEWYKKFGFEVFQTEPAILMARKVQQNRIVTLS